MNSHSLLEVLEKEIDEQLELFGSLWPRYEQTRDEFGPHRQRTSVNRLTGYAMFLGINIAYEAKSHPLRVMRRWQKVVGPIRDIDIMRRWVRQIARIYGEMAAPAAHELDEELLRRRDESLGRIRDDAKGHVGANVRYATEATRQRLNAALQKFKSGREELIPTLSLEMVRLPWSEALDGLAKDMSDKALHRFRVKNKRLRFVVDVLHAASIQAGEERMDLRAAGELLAEVHTVLGHLSDLAVLDGEIREARRRWSLDGAVLPESVAALEHGRLDLERQELDRWFEIYPQLVHLEIISPDSK